MGANIAVSTGRQCFPGLRNSHKVGGVLEARRRTDCGPRFQMWGV